MSEQEEFTGAVLFCPCCCTNVDAEQWGHNDLECGNCGTKFTVELDQQKVAEHAMYG